MSTNTFPLVGARFRPPALALIESLSVGTPLWLIAEPENPYDVNAVAVWLYSKDIPETAKEQLEERLPAFGHSVESVMTGAQWHLGYIAKEFAAELRSRNVVKVDAPAEVYLSFSSSGQPRVRFEEPPY